MLLRRLLSAPSPCTYWLCRDAVTLREVTASVAACCRPMLLLLLRQLRFAVCRLAALSCRAAAALIAARHDARGHEIDGQVPAMQRGDGRSREVTRPAVTGGIWVGAAACAWQQLVGGLRSNPASLNDAVLGPRSSPAHQYLFFTSFQISAALASMGTACAHRRGASSIWSAGWVARGGCCGCQRQGAASSEAPPRMSCSAPGAPAPAWQSRRTPGGRTAVRGSQRRVRAQTLPGCTPRQAPGRHARRTMLSGARPLKKE